MWALSLSQLRRRLRTGHQLPPRTIDNQRLLELLLYFFGFSPEFALSRSVLLSLPHSTLSHTHSSDEGLGSAKVKKKWFFGFSYLIDNRSVLYFFFSSVAQCIYVAQTLFFFFIYYVYFLLMIINLEFFYFYFYFFSGSGGPC